MLKKSCKIKINANRRVSFKSFFLENKGIEVIDTDLGGERIVQLRNEPPSHIVLPAIHLKKI